MGAIRMRLAAELRARWVAWLGLAAVIGIFAGAVLATAAGARRTESAYDRFLVETNAWDAVTFYAPFDPSFATLEHEKVAALPAVSDSVEAFFYETDGEVDAIGTSDPSFGRTFQAAKMLEGRFPDPDRTDEVSVPYERAPDLGVGIGDRLTLRMHRRGPSGGFAPGPAIEQSFEVVGIHVMAGEFPPHTGEEDPMILLTPAFHRANVDRLFQFGIGFFHLDGGTAAFGTFHDQLGGLAGGKPFFAISQNDQTGIANEALGMIGAGLAALAAVLAFVGMIAFGQAIARQTFLDADGYPAVRALGMTAGQLRLIGLIRIGGIAVVAAVVAVATAIALSPLAPIGMARLIEPDPGVAVDLAVLSSGAVAIVGVILLLAVIPIVRSARRERQVPTISASRSRVARLAFLMGGSPTMVNGIRLALERGRGSAAMPVVTTIGMTAVGLAALTVAGTFGTSLDRVLDDPALYGLRWDLEVSVDTAGARFAESPSFALAEEIREIEGVVAAGVMDSGVPLTIGDVSAAGILYDPEARELAPQLIRGRDPVDDDEVALGERTLRQVGASLGDRIAIELPGLPPSEFEIVGTAALPGYVTADSLGEGTMFHPTALLRMIPDPPPPSSIYVTLEDGADPAAVREQIRSIEQVLEMRDRWVPSAIGNLESIRTLPFGVAGLLAVLAVAAITHALVSSVRRRAHELAILRALGFVRRQVAAVVGWQAATLAVVALLIGLPVGIGAGRWLWSVAAERLGVVVLPVTSFATLGLVFAGALLAAFLVSLWPSRAASRIPPAVVLRTE